MTVLGLLRFTDSFSRLHALTKADNLGLGLITIGLVPQVETNFEVLQLIITWALVMISGAVSSFLIANHGLCLESDMMSFETDQKGQQRDHN